MMCILLLRALPRPKAQRFSAHQTGVPMRTTLRWLLAFQHKIHSVMRIHVVAMTNKFAQSSRMRKKMKKSNGIRWAVLMMHPQNKFPEDESYTEWLDGFHKLAQQQTKYDIRYIHFQDLVNL